MITLTKSALAAGLLAVMAVSAQAQQNGNTRQIQVLAAPAQAGQFQQSASANFANQVQAQAPIEQNAPVQQAAPVEQAAPIQDAGPAEQDGPRIQKFRTKVVEVVEAPEPKFIEKRVEKRHYQEDRHNYRPSYGYSYGSAKRYSNHCH